MAASNNPHKIAVLDIGSRTSRAGFAGELSPSFVCPSLVGRIHNAGLALSALSPDQQSKNSFVGAECESKLKIPGLLTPFRPYQEATYEHWDEAEELWKYLLQTGLSADPTKTPVIMTEPPMMSKETRERITQIYFESLQVPSLYLVSSAACAIANAGFSEGLVIDCGETVCSSVPVVELHALSNCSRLMHFGGNDLTDLLVQLLLDRKTTIETPAERDVVDKAKETHCFVALSHEDEQKKVQFNQELNRPLGSKLAEQLKHLEAVTIGKERFEVPEALFKPNLVGKDTTGLAASAIDCILKCNVDIRPQLCERVVLCGGGAQFPGLAERLARDMDTGLARGGGGGKIKLPPVQVLKPAVPYQAWNGAAVIGCLPDCLDRFMSKDLYEEYGPTLVHKMCFQ